MLEVRLLGQFDIRLDGEVVNINSRADQSLFAYSILNAGAAFRREHLAGLVWPDSVESNTKGYLRQALWRLRKAFTDCNPSAPDYFLADKITLAFDTRHTYWLDVVILKEQGNVQLDDLLAATQVYKDELLPGFYDEWVLLEREQLRALLDRKMERLLEGLQSAKRWDDLLQQAERWISIGDSPELAYRGLILAYAAKGDVSSALFAYKRCVQVLERELGVSPSLETVRLADQLRSGNLVFERMPESHAHAYPPQATGLPAHPGSAIELQEYKQAQDKPSKPIFHHEADRTEVIHNQPTQSTSFIGREVELGEIEAWLANPDCRMLTLLGPGGIGKSQLAWKACEQLLDSYRQGVCFVSLAGIESIESIPFSIFSALALKVLGESDPKKQLFRYLRDREMLLVLDNFEHLVSGSGLLSALLQHAPRVKLLVTSRERLNLKSEWVYPLEGLAFPNSDAELGEEPYASMTLFAQTAQRIRSNFTLNSTNQSSVARICHLVEGMPLAIELAAAWIPVLEPQEIANEVEHSLDILEVDFQDLPPRQRSMRAVFNASWEMLNPEEQISIEKLSIFRGGFTLVAAEKAFGISIRMLLALVNKCWVQPETYGRFHIHELLRQFALVNLRADGDLFQSANKDHSVYFCGFLKECESEWFGSRLMEIFSGIKTEIQNIEAAWKWALEGCCLDLIGQAMESLCEFYIKIGRRRDGENASRAAVDRLKAKEFPSWMDETEACFLQVRALTWQGLFSDDQEVSLRLFNEARAILDRLDEIGCDTRSEEANLLSAEGEIVLFFDPQKARELVIQSAVLHKAVGNEARQAEDLNRLGLSAWMVGDLDQALHLSQQSLALMKSMGEHIGISGAMDLLAKVFREKGNLDEAEQYHYKCLTSAQKLGYLRDETVILINLATTLICMGRFSEAQVIAQESSRLQEVISDPNVPYRYSTLARALLHQGAYKQARVWAARSLEEAKKDDDPLIGISLTSMAEIDLVENRLAEAMESLEKSLTATQAREQIILSGIPLADLVYTARAMNQLLQAGRYLFKCLEEAAKIGSFRIAIHALPAVALLEADQGSIERAIELYSLACKYPYVSNSKWFEEMAGNHIASLSATLPPETVASAGARGNSLEFWEVVKQWLEDENHSS